MEMTLALPRCDASGRSAGGCRCGCNGEGDLAGGISSLPWWVWLVAVGLFVIASGDEEMKGVFFGAKPGARRRGRRR